MVMSVWRIEDDVKSSHNESSSIKVLLARLVF